MAMNLTKMNLRATILPTEFFSLKYSMIHMTQLEGIYKAIDGINIMVLTLTGCRKTGYFTMYMLPMLPELIQRSMKKVPPNPVMVIIVFPTNRVEEGILMVCRNQTIVTDTVILT